MVGLKIFHNEFEILCYPKSYLAVMFRIFINIFRKKSLADAQIQGRTSFGQLQHLMSEFLGLCKVWVDHQFHVIAESLNRDYQVQLRSKYSRKRTVVQEALRVTKQISLQLNIRLICSYFKDVHCYNAIVELCLTAAAQVDPNGIALQYYRNGELAEDQQGLNLNLKRIECYKPVLNTIRHEFVSSQVT